MKRKLRFLAGACLFTATALFSGCSSDDDFLMDPVDSGTSQTRAVTNSHFPTGTSAPISREIPETGGILI